MSFTRFPVCCPVTYQVGPFEGHGTVWNLSLTGWRFSGNLPLRIGEVCSLAVNLSIDQRIYVAAGIVRWEWLYYRIPRTRGSLVYSQIDSYIPAKPSVRLLWLIPQRSIRHSH